MYNQDFGELQRVKYKIGWLFLVKQTYVCIFKHHYVTKEVTYWTKCEGNVEKSAVEQFIDQNFMQHPNGTLMGLVDKATLHTRLSGLVKVSHIQLPVYEYRSGNLVAQANNPFVMVGGSQVRLSLTEFNILVYLLTHKGQVVQREKLVNDVWKGEVVGFNLLDTHFSNMRRKLKGFNGKINTIRNLGYILKDY